MRLCLRELPETFAGPEAWIRQLKLLGLSAAHAPVDEKVSDAEIAEYVQAARENDIVISETNAWGNPLSMDPDIRDAAFRRCVTRLALAEKLGARCCVNIAGSRSAQWDGPHKDNFGDAFLDELVSCVQRIVDEVGPKRTFYTLEPMPFMPPDSPESYLALLKAVDRKGFAVHADIVNLLSSPRLYYDNGAFIRRFFQLLSPWHIASCHIKDISLGGGLTVHLSEVPMGEGGLDAAAYLRAVAALEQDTTLVLEHQASAAHYQKGLQHLREVATRHEIPMR